MNSYKIVQYIEDNDGNRFYPKDKVKVTMINGKSFIDIIKFFNHHYEHEVIAFYAHTLRVNKIIKIEKVEDNA